MKELMRKLLNALTNLQTKTTSLLKEYLGWLVGLTPNADKLQHFFYGAIIYTLVWVFFGIVGSTQDVQAIMSYGIVTIVAWAKEFYIDKKIGGHTSVWDAVYTMLPCSLFGLVLIFNN